LVKDPAERAELRPVVDAIAETTFERWLSRRTAEGHRLCREWAGLWGLSLAYLPVCRLLWMA
jgi:hypothetical protein